MKKLEYPFLFAFAMMIGAAPLGAQLGVIETNQASLITFGQEVIPGVYRYAPGDTHGPSVAEPGNWAMVGENGRMAFDARSWAWQNGDNLRTTHPFQADANNNGLETDRWDFHADASVVTNSYIPALGEGGFAFRFNENRWISNRLTLKVDNNTGMAIDEWVVTLDTWFDDNNFNPSTLRLLVGTTWSPEAVGYTELGARTATQTGGGLSDMLTIGGTLNQTIAAGDSLYIQIFHDQSGQGTAFTIKDLSVTAIPEPSTYALFAALAVIVVAALRRRKQSFRV
ncbi:MAG: PEP-CTERM sorting domain-containing protein [Puniceicoccaceae bacterium]|nr:MAG: PEP-CTERM sorting domain-containing protein [Puniceicoccaceae bacterium]